MKPPMSGANCASAADGSSGWEFEQINNKVVVVPKELQ
jgi:hypothetical protein